MIRSHTLSLQRRVLQLTWYCHSMPEIAMDSSQYVRLNISLERSPLFPNPLTCINDIAKTTASEPIALHLKLNKDSIEKFPESMWKFFIYTITWIWSAYITYDRDLMFNLASHWEYWYPGVPVDRNIYWLFTFEVGFYLHYTYGMLFLETRRKDFAVLMLHHMLTIALIVGCCSVRIHVVGVLLIFIHDIGDIFLEASKSVTYCKEQDGKLIKWVDLCSNIGFFLFSTQYFLFRIYWFVTKALYSTLHVGVIMYPGAPFYLPFNVMLVTLLAMQIFWFGLIVKLLVKVLVLREELEDIRDIKEEERTGVTRDRVQKPNGIPSSTENKKTQ